MKDLTRIMKVRGGQELLIVFATGPARGKNVQKQMLPNVFVLGSVR